MTSKLPFLLHTVIETPAAFTFIFTPHRQLQDVQPATRLILQQYGGLLLSSNLVCLVLCTSDSLGHVENWLAAALGFYHIWPCYRAMARLSGPVLGDVRHTAVLGGPLVHLIIHLLLFLLFAHKALF
ncbi:hypothetical protein BJ166DRAFT_514720 [Pestalotiopsis sp. NC0098]|nr:hypothetical protein BJ166DRAFT_514720 [Pestalotiopsis sp. NC0098]